MDDWIARARELIALAATQRRRRSPPAAPWGVTTSAG